ncbi:lipopolysaccharide kinase (Kdo/WaaP) family protein [Flavobacterium glaciei]|uniref:Lipopolysaccharide kinase (Kdo/WaaP) family protein n=2 Tax=Flavobacterium glaciei TaxID=386300 RepID=A0A562Q1T9_9FLAO|nr:lipopolysaccharide kinase (Kdo/WaaP) family protein [Flavobacterium glaciei]TWI50661.1 lipopolysaccharide kinase (Kdo/WaaP) family protein [Flavobacterium glaciei]
MFTLIIVLMQINIHSHFLSHKSKLSSCIENFDTKGILFGDGKRNKIKLFDLDSPTINIKSFKIPNLINKIAYKYFRKSKARRSYEYAANLLENGIGTPQPIAYFENYNWLGLKESYYVSEHLVTELTFRELVEIPDYPDHENILRQFTKFSFDLHEKGIEFLDHSPGNTLIKKVSEKQYQFFLVDLNRMNFHAEMDINMRMKNLSRLTPKKEMIEIMSDEYAKLYNKSFQDVFDIMWYNTCKFQEKYHRKRRLKAKYFFWK